jgi:FtsP/CotA-like multicopper oxidase with cupredoxin domain
VIINGPASSNYDEDVGVILLSDWDINTVDQLWTKAEANALPELDNGLINGVNVFGGDDDSKQTGYCFNTTFIPGKSYRLRVTNPACDTLFKFSIHHHIMSVIAADFVAIQPYNTTVLSVAIGR